jgi:hypothetical protein
MDATRFDSLSKAVGKSSSRRQANKLLGGVAGITLMGMATSQFAVAGQTVDPDNMDAVRAATARYNDLAVAESDGYALLEDEAGIACIDNPGTGAMGVHYANGALVEAGKIDALKPQVLVYEPTAEGCLRLVGVEYVVFQEAWDAAHDSPPALFGEEFMLTAAGNRYGLPAFYSLHAWAWKSNPSGTFAMWNPDVRCA